MGVGDVPAASSVGAEVGWPGRERRFAFFVGHPYCEAVMAEADGRAVGVGFGTRNGAAGWIGLVCVRPGYQGRGIGAAITERVAELLEGRGCRTLVLTVTASGRPVYERLGFSVETHYRGFAGPGLQPEPPEEGVRPMAPEDLPSVCDLDRRMTGEDRSHLLRALAGPGWVMDGDDGGVIGYHLPVPWGGGPLITPDPDAAKALTRLARTLAGPDGNVTFWLAEENEAGADLMAEMEFERSRCLPRMVRGEPSRWSPGSLWGLFSLGRGDGGVGEPDGRPRG